MRDSPFCCTKTLNTLEWITLLKVRNHIARTNNSLRCFERMANVYLLFVCILTLAFNSKSLTPFDEVHYQESKSLIYTPEEKGLINFFAVSLCSTLWVLLIHKIFSCS